MIFQIKFLLYFCPTGLLFAYQSNQSNSNDFEDHRIIARTKMANHHYQELQKNGENLIKNICLECHDEREEILEVAPLSFYQWQEIMDEMIEEMQEEDIYMSEKDRSTIVEYLVNYSYFLLENSNNYPQKNISKRGENLLAYLHPVLLHFPIVIGLFLVFFIWTIPLLNLIIKINVFPQKSNFIKLHINNITFYLKFLEKYFFLIMAASLILTVLSGQMWYFEKTTISNDLKWHRYMGYASIIIMGLASLLYFIYCKNKRIILYQFCRILITLMGALIAICGHYGGLSVY